MSWWESVVNKAKGATASWLPVRDPSDGAAADASAAGARATAGATGSGIASAAATFTTTYQPTNNPISKVIGEGAGAIVSGIAGMFRGLGTSEAAPDAPTRITTRARLTYELDRFEKNAMLMFVQILSDLNEGCRIIDATNKEVSELATTFGNLRFEVYTHTDLTCSEVEQKCVAFFQRDFREYGAVMVVVLTFEGTYGHLSAKDGRFSESIILRHLADNANSTLRAKPKIYITEANRKGDFTTTGRYSLPLEEHHQDILGLHIPSLYSENIGKIRPLVRLCQNVREKGDRQDFVSIVRETVEETPQFIPVFNTTPIELTNKLSKELILARRQATPT